ncbi:MAG: VPLPA-CTERM sorting domain-containing protein [Pseudomonadota bacterium]
MKRLLILVGCVTSWVISAGVNATTYTVIGPGAGSSSFGANVVHDAINGTITNVNGTYDDVTGVLNLNFDINSGGGTTSTSFISTNMFFTGGVLSTPGGATANANFSPALAANTSATFSFAPQIFGCCNSDGFGPNSFRETSTPGIFQLTLWGETTTPFKHGDPLGMDLRVKLQAVPLPAGVILFATALAGLFGVRRRQLKTAELG